MPATEVGGTFPYSLNSRMHLKGITVCSSPEQDDTPHREVLSWVPPITLQGCPSAAPYGFSEPSPSPGGVTVWKDKSPQIHPCTPWPLSNPVEAKVPKQTQTNPDFYPRHADDQRLSVPAAGLRLASGHLSYPNKSLVCS